MTSKPVLYYTPGSSVMLCAAALGLELDLKVVNLKDGDHLTPEFIKMNPTHTIPVLNDDGVVVTDSHVICSYLADKYAVDDTLYPKDKTQRMQVDSRLYFDCGHLFPRVRLMVEPVIYFGEATISEEKIRYMQRAYDGLEKALTGGKYLCGENLTIADLCCAASVASAEKFAPIEEEKYPKVKAWLQCLSELPYYKKFNQEQADILYNLVQTKFAENKKA